MPYFSRLTDIVTCDLTALLEDADDPAATLEEILQEMDQGLEASKRSVRTARESVERIERDISRHQADAEHWQQEARTALQAEDEATARAALRRKKEADSLVQGLRQSLDSAIATREQLTTTYHALSARRSDAQRRQAELGGTQPAPVATTDDLSDEIDAELAALKQSLAEQ